MNQKEYASIIESLRYVTDCTRPDIAYAVKVLGRFTSKPGNEQTCFNKSYEIFNWNEKLWFVLQKVSCCT